MGEGISPRSLPEAAAPGESSRSVLSRLLTWDPSFQALLHHLPRLAATNLPVLITGGPGTGKTSTVAKILNIMVKGHPDLVVKLAAHQQQPGCRQAGRVFSRR